MSVRQKTLVIIIFCYISKLFAISEAPSSYFHKRLQETVKACAFKVMDTNDNYERINYNKLA